jgi:hypothetical protein
MVKRPTAKKEEAGRRTGAPRPGAANLKLQRWIDLRWQAFSLRRGEHDDRALLAEDRAMDRGAGAGAEGEMNTTIPRFACATILAARSLRAAFSAARAVHRRGRRRRTLISVTMSPSEVRIVREPITRTELAEMAQARFGDMVKGVVDVARGVMAVSGELHSDEEALLLDDGSRQADLWGINLYPGESGPDWIEFDSMINVRPSQNNRSRGVEDERTRTAICRIVQELVRG